MPEPRLEGFRAGTLCVRTWERISRLSTHTVRNCVAGGRRGVRGAVAVAVRGGIGLSAPRGPVPAASVGRDGRTGLVWTDRVLPGQAPGTRDSHRRRHHQPAPARAPRTGTAHERLPGPGRATEAGCGSLDCAIKVPLGHPVTQSRSREAPGARAGRAGRTGCSGPVVRPGIGAPPRALATPRCHTPRCHPAPIAQPTRQRRPSWKGGRRSAREQLAGDSRQRA
jgi:hypothetical protein